MLLRKVGLAQLHTEFDPRHRSCPAKYYHAKRPPQCGFVHTPQRPAIQIAAYFSAAQVIAGTYYGLPNGENRPTPPQGRFDVGEYQHRPLEHGFVVRLKELQGR